MTTPGTPLAAPASGPGFTGSSAAAAEAIIETPTWSLPTRIAFRFLFIYLILYLLPFPLEYVPIDAAADVVRGYTEMWQKFIPWAAGMLHIGKVQINVTGSGDTLFAYLQTACFVIIAAAGALTWSLLSFASSLSGRTARRYVLLHDWLRIYVRFALASILLGYGMHKVFKLQFQYPGPSQLYKTWGDSSPMNVLWNFMGYSTPYTVFTGLAEVVGGVLLLFRRTTTLGALVSAGVLVNVVMLNFCYDVPVKLYSSHLLLMSLFLLAPEHKRLLGLLVLNRAVAPAELRLQPPWRWLRWGSWLVKAPVVGYILWVAISSNYRMNSQMGEDSPKPSLWGAFQVESFERNKASIAPLANDSSRWRRLYFSGNPFAAKPTESKRLTEPQPEPGFIVVEAMDASRTQWSVINNTRDHTVTISQLGANLPPSTLSYESPEADVLVLSGTLGKDEMVIRLRKIDLSALPLSSRGFHWISEFPYNR